MADDLRAQVQHALSGTYTLERELGGGGMSRVFVAEEHKLGRKVVVKVLSPELAASISTGRFEREIRVAASLQQANIVPLLSAGELEGLPYYTMPYVEGESLRARLGRGTVSIAETVSILRDVSRALAYAHERGVVHRDIKPDNVLLSGHTAVVTDFGIAKAIADAAAGPAGATLTQLGTAVGTPMYMAPEQAAGDPDTDHRADIYAFGCMAYELIAGRPPFSGLAPHKLLAAHMTETPKPVAELRIDCPPELAALVMQCLEKEPASRPANATELLRRLDVVASPTSPHAAMPGILLGGRAMLQRALAMYAGAFVVVAIVARAAIIAIGLPDWVFPGSLIVMALGLPVILFTAYAQYVSHRMAMATPTYTPGGTPSLAGGQGTMATLAIKASPHMSWKRTARSGLVAVCVFALLVAGWMILRALGIGPAGSLLASGKLSASDKVIVAAFDAPASDISLGSTIAEAVRTNLSQSHAVRVVQTSAVVAALEMKRPDTARVDFATAREIAQRSGAKAVVGGSIVPAGAGYIVTARLVAAESGDELASYRESAKDAGDLIPTVDRLTKSLREKIGESLKTVRDAPRLDQVTTASLGALRSYAAGLNANDVQADYPAAVQYFRDAIRQDSTFAMAYVQLAYSLLTQGGRGSTTKANSALTSAFQLRDHLPERERYNVEGAYYQEAAPDRTKSISAFRHAVALDSTNVDAVNSLAVSLSSTRDFASADRLYRLALVNDPGVGTIMGNLAGDLTLTGEHAAFDSLMAVMATSVKSFPTGALRYENLWNRRDYDAAEHFARKLADSASQRSAKFGQDALVEIATLRGKLQEADRLQTQVIETNARVRGDTANPYYTAYATASRDIELRGNERRGLATLDAALHANPPAALPVERDGSSWLALGYARLGEPAKARELMKQYVARLDTAARRRQFVPLSRLQGAIALAEGHADSAIAYFRRGDAAADGLPTINCTVCTPLFLGLSFDRGGHADSARVYLTKYAEMTGTNRTVFDPFYLAPALYRLGELYASAGDTVRATEYYGRFADLWKNADAELQPRVAEAKARIARLNKSKQ